MLILDRLLFRPMLKVMDERQEKIDRAAKKKETDRKLREDAEAARQERLAQNAALTAEREQEAISAAKRSAEQMLSAARTECERDMQARKEALDGEKARFEQELETGLEELAEAFAAKFVS